MSNHRKGENPTGAGKKPAMRVAFDSRLRLEFHGSKVTSDAGLLAYRELDAALGLTDLGENLLSDWRTGKNINSNGKSRLNNQELKANSQHKDSS
jgi:hypothetical protein